MGRYVIEKNLFLVGRTTIIPLAVAAEVHQIVKVMVRFLGEIPITLLTSSLILLVICLRGRHKK